MTDNEKQSLDRAVGKIEAKLDAFQANWVEQDRRASDGRKFLYERVENFGRDVQAMGHQLTTVVNDVAEMKPAVKDWVDTKNQAMGAKSTASILAKALYGLCGGLLIVVGWAISHASALLVHIP